MSCRGVVRNGGRLRDRPEAVDIAWREQMRVGCQNLRRHLLERSNVIQNPKATPVCCQGQVVKALLHRNPIHGSMRQPALQRLPGFAIVERNVQAILCSQVKLPFAHGILANAMRVAQHAVRNAVRDLRPRFPVIRGLIGERITIVHLMEIHRDVCRSRVVARSFDIAHRSPIREIRNVFCDVGPVLPAIARDLHVPVIGTCPNQAGFFGRFGDCKHRSRIFHANIVRSEPARDSHAALVVARQVRADDLPTIAAVGGDVHKLAADIDFVVVVR